MMTKQIYIETARNIRASGVKGKALDIMISNFADTFAQDNSRFDRARFEAACREGLVQARKGTVARVARKVF